jgi:hypothetical protein
MFSKWFASLEFLTSCQLLETLGHERGASEKIVGPRNSKMDRIFLILTILWVSCNLKSTIFTLSTKKLDLGWFYTESSNKNIRDRASKDSLNHSSNSRFFNSILRVV